MQKTPVAYLSSNDGHALFFFGKGPVIRCKTGKALDQLDAFTAENKGKYLVAFLGYDLKNEIEGLVSENENLLEFPDLFCWSPAYVVELNEGKEPVFLQGTSDDFSHSELELLQKRMNSTVQPLPEIKFKSRISKAKYITEVENIQKEIQYGNTYELNFCQDFYAENVPGFDAWQLIKQQNNLTKAPFSAFVEFDEFQVFCGSPERFIRKDGSRIFSQPIKGTIRRGADFDEDEQLKLTLQFDEKERAENIMITDLVRNDLSKIAKKNSVNVDELCGIHTFETLHHMISTVSCDLKPETSFSDILRATFPMGSMTGAPKIRSMELIEKHESFKRGLYSGSIGYFKPNGDFDFNVVIRSFLLNLEKRVISCPVGGAITIKSVPENEYQECLVKVKRMVQLFGDDQDF